jgi:hypothetical protein
MDVVGAMKDGTLLVIVSNVMLSSALVIVNKVLAQQYHFSYMTLLATFHFSSSLLLSMLLVLTGWVTYKPVNNYFSIMRIALVRYMIDNRMIESSSHS